ncbi:DUF6177 family protein [Frondihabitans cladoniiphilus]|uniref:DUF6177 family protein n=1 Tax=Frondihabitans cladoniiphilus TaxID=715785 RepID=A0ABP8WEK9_9MICO
MGIKIRHPLVDEVLKTVVRVDSRASVVRLSPALAELLERRLPARRTVVLVTPETSRLTIGLRTALVAAGGSWTVTTAQGFRDGLTGVDRLTVEVHPPLSRPGAAAPGLHEPDGGPDGAADAEHDDPPLEPTSRDASPDEITAQLSLDVTLLHEAAESDTYLGEALEAMAAAVGVSEPRAWGRTEPLDHAWDRWAMTQDARHHYPAASRYVVEGEHLSASVTARLTDRGVEETIALTLDVPDGTDGLDTAIARLREGLSGLTRTATPTFALVLARMGEHDRSFRAVTYPPPNPVALLIGAPSVAELGLHEQIFAESQDVVVVGAPTSPAYLLPLGGSELSGWDALHDALDSVGNARVTTLVEPPLLQAWEDDLHDGLDRTGEPHPHDAPASGTGRAEPRDEPRAWDARPHPEGGR